jgi:hypothetical protein
MRYNFSSEFFHIIPPSTSFGKAWEAFCYDLLKAEFNDPSLQRFEAPDTGIDIWHKSTASVYQCKSDERGALGSLSANDSIQSLQAAVKFRKSLNWANLFFATNANYTGTAIKKILEESSSLGLTSEQINFRGPEYWSDLCEKHFDKVAHYLDYRIKVTEEQVIEAFRKARYYDEYIKKFEKSISDSTFVLKIKNNRTPVELEVPFSPELSVENCVDAIQELLGVSLKWTNFSDLGTSSGPSISLSVNRKGQTFSQKIEDVEKSRGNEDLEFWITLIWRDETKCDGEDAKTVYNLSRLQYNFLTLDRNTLNYEERRNITLERTERMIQTMIWKNAIMLKTQTF